MRTLAAAAALVMGMGVSGCGGAPAPVVASAGPAETSGEAAADELKAPGEAKVGDKTRCTVMNHIFVVTASTASYEHDGKTYYFCCPGCIEQFKANPSKYLPGK